MMASSENPKRSSRSRQTLEKSSLIRPEMADSPRRRYSKSPSPYNGLSRSRSQSRGRSRSKSRSPQPRTRVKRRSRSPGRNEATNPGNTLYVTGLSSRVTETELEDHFSRQGKVARCQLIVEPRTRVSRGFAFITMDTSEDADSCIKHLNQSILEGRNITVEKSRRKRPRTPTPGSYLGATRTRGSYRERGRYHGGYSRDDYGGYRRSPPHRGGRDFSPRRSPYNGRYRRERSRSLPYSPNRSPYRDGYGRYSNGYPR